ncbi:MAG: YheV family putative metal-binding protein [Halomonas sp.]|nr:YheV family putative metal-binding protein [Halomonas sp.]MDR9438488.1 YheV family putative metal-binding protein [Halomonas sp.]
MTVQKRFIVGAICPRCADVDEQRSRAELASFQCQ